MLFAFVLHDAPGMAARRLEVRPEHKAYLGAVAERIAFAGPLLDEAGDMCGSLLVIDFDDRAAASPGSPPSPSPAPASTAAAR